MVLERINAFVWGVPALFLILGAGIFLSVRTHFFHVRVFPKAFLTFIRKLIPEKKQCNGVSSFQALCTALAATVGTGNIAGVAGAIAIGGPGAVFWMWVSAFWGMIIKFAEATLCVKFRVCDANGPNYGGPMHMIRSGLPHRWHFLAWLYAFFGVIAAFGVGNATQINACLTGIVQAASVFGVVPGPMFPYLIAAVITLLVASILLGGAKRIGQLSQWLVPFAAVGYLLLGFGVLLLRAEQLPYALYSIFYGAFSPQAVTGGAIGSMFLALRVGVSRGVFTNEAGMGTAGIAHAGASVSHPVEQGLMGIIEVFLDTVVICTVTALVILCSGIPVTYGTDQGAMLTNDAFASVYGTWVVIPIALFLCCFAFATMVGWGLYGIRCAQFLFGKGALKTFVTLQCITSLLSVMLGTGTIWILADIVNALMAMPNLIAILMLTPVLIKLIQDYKMKSSRISAHGGTYEDFNQRQSLRAVTYAKIPSSGSCGRERGQKNLSAQHWST